MTQILSLPDLVGVCQEAGEQTQPTFLLDSPKLEGEAEASTDSRQINLLLLRYRVSVGF